MLAWKPPALDRAQSAGPQLYDALRRQILSASIKPGQALSESRVALQFGVSRTPVRQIFQRLAEEGFLRIVPQVGTFVAAIPLNSVHDSQFVRETLECRAAALAAQNATREDQKALADNLALQRSCLKKRDHLGFFAADEAMHEIIMAMSGHPNAWALIAAAKTQLDRVRYLSLESADWLQMIYEQHSHIVDLISAGDPAAVTSAMADHLRTAFAAIERIALENADFFDRSPAGISSGGEIHARNLVQKRRKTP